MIIIMEPGTSQENIDRVVKSLENKGFNGSNVEAAKLVGTSLAKKAKEAGITKVVFDRGGYLYHGRVKALADALRDGGLEF